MANGDDEHDGGNSGGGGERLVECAIWEWWEEALWRRRQRMWPEMGLRPVDPKFPSVGVVVACGFGRGSEGKLSIYD